MESVRCVSRDIKSLLEKWNTKSLIGLPLYTQGFKWQHVLWKDFNGKVKGN